MEELLGGPCDYTELRRVSGAATEEDRENGARRARAGSAAAARSSGLDHQSEGSQGRQTGGGGGGDGGGGGGSGGRNRGRGGYRSGVSGVRGSVTFDPGFVGGFRDANAGGGRAWVDVEAEFFEDVAQAAASGRGGGGDGGSGGRGGGYRSGGGFSRGEGMDADQSLEDFRAAMQTEVGSILGRVGICIPPEPTNGLHTLNPKP